MSTEERFETVRGADPQGRFAELWDRTRAPGGLALELRMSEDGEATLTGYGVDVPWSVAHHFLSEAAPYVRRDSQAAAPPDEPDHYRMFCNALLGMIDDAEICCYDPDGLAHLREASGHFQSHWRSIQNSRGEPGESGGT